MLIKVYTLDFPTVLHIIENVSDVRIDKNIHPFGHIGITNPDSVYSFDGESSVGNSVGVKEKSCGTCHVDFTKNGISHRLLVSNYAYVCNDEGKTIEKVSAT